jgi:phospholipid transport system substrate-binding protein
MIPMRRAVCLFVILFMSTPALAQVSQPMEALRKPIERGISILKDPLYKDSDKKELQREKIWEIIREAFDFNAVAMRTLVSYHRKRFTPQQKKEFTDAFAEFLKTIYLDKLLGEFHDEEVIFLAQDMLTDSKALVKTRVLRQNTEIPMDYSMWRRDGTWLIYDVKVEGVSLIKNYRIQFDKILLKESPADLIERLKKKIVEQTNGEPARK